MDFDDDYPLLHVPDLMLALLRVAASGEGTVEAAVALLRANLKAAREEPPVSDAEIAERLRAARDRLAAAGLLEPAGDGRFRLSALGSRVLDENPDGVDESVLAHYVESFRLAARADEPPPGDAAPAGPEGGSSAPPRQREYEEGVSAFREGREISANPYPLQTDQHQAWEAGWCEARDEAFGPTALGG